MVKKYLQKSYRVIQVCTLILAMFLVTKVSITKENKQVSNINLNKTLDLHAMAVKINEIQMNDKYYVLDTYVGDLTAYVAYCPLCSGYLGCNGQNVLDGTTTYVDELYGTVRIVASSSNLPCGSIIQFDTLSGSKETAIVLDRGVLGNDIDLLVSNETEAYSLGRRQTAYNVLRYGWEREMD